MASASSAQPALPPKAAVAKQSCQTVRGWSSLASVGDRPISFGPQGIVRLDVKDDKEDPRGTGWPGSLREGQAIVRASLVDGSSLEQMAMVVSKVPVGKSPPELWSLGKGRWSRVPLPVGATDVIALHAYGDGISIAAVIKDSNRFAVVRGKLELPRSQNPHCGPRGAVMTAATGRDGSLVLLHDDCAETPTSQSVRRFDAERVAQPAFVPKNESPFSSPSDVAIASERTLVLLSNRGKVAWTLVGDTPTELAVEGLGDQAALGARSGGGVLLKTAHGILRLDREGKPSGPLVTWEAFTDQEGRPLVDEMVPVEGIDGAWYFEQRERGSPASSIVRCTAGAEKAR